MANGNIIFFGTSDICIPFLDELRNHFPIPLIITQPDARAGRKRKLIPPPVKTYALRHDIPFLQPETLSDPPLKETIRKIRPEIGVVVSYGKLIPRSIFTIPQHHTVNVHFSLLPAYRGAAPVQRAIQNGDTVTGITIFSIRKKLDSGDIWSRTAFPIGDEQTAGDVFDLLSREGARILPGTIHDILEKRITPAPQNHEEATYAKPLEKAEGKIRWEQPAAAVYNHFRGFTPCPGVSFTARTGGECFGTGPINPPGKGGEMISFKVTGMTPAPESHRKAPGEILSLDKNGMKVCCGNHSVINITEFQPQCKKPMPPHCYLLGNTLPKHLD